MKSFKSFVLALAVVSVLGVAESASAQVFQKGLSFALPTGGGASIGYTHWMDSYTSVRADVGFDLTNNEGSDATFGFSIDAGYRKYMGGSASIKAFTEPGVFLAKSAGGAGDVMDKVTLAGTYAIGAEYYVSSNFSFGGKAGIALTFSDGFGSFSLKTGTSSLKTGTSSLFANYYW